MNPIFAIPARLTVAHEEDITGGALNFPGEQSRMAVPHVLKDGADSVGIDRRAEPRLRQHRRIQPAVAARPQCASSAARRNGPSACANAQKNSVYWQATAERMPNLAKFLMKMNGPRLQDAPGGKAFLTQDEKLLQRGKIVFAENCAKCHSSKQPPAGFHQDSAAIPRLDARRSAKARLPRQQLSVHRRAHSGRRCANQRSARSRHQCRLAGTSGTTSHPRPTRPCRRSAKSKSSIRSTVRPASFACPAAVPAITACHRSSASGRPRRCCTTTRSASTPAIRRSRAG